MTYLLDTNAISDLMRADARIENWIWRNRLSRARPRRLSCQYCPSGVIPSGLVNATRPGRIYRPKWGLGAATAKVRDGDYPLIWICATQAAVAFCIYVMLRFR
jgi:hypothetical protein